MRERSKAWGLLLCTAMLASCGGDSGGSGSTAASITSTVAVTPTPTPTPTSSASATASDYSRDASFNAVGLKLTFGNDVAHQATAVALIPENSAIGFDFFTAMHGYNLRFYGETLSLSSTIQTLHPYYSDSNFGFNRSAITIASGSSETPSIYSGYVLWSDTPDPKYLGSQQVQRYMLFGVHTPPAEVPQAGVKTFRGIAAVNTSRQSYIAYIYSNDYPITFTVDYAQHSVTGIMTLSSTAGPIVVNFAGTLDTSTGRVSGKIAGGLSGSFEGALYGPAATELSLLYVAQDSIGSYYGVIASQ